MDGLRGDLASNAGEHDDNDMHSFEQSLLASFRTAARSVTQLYKDAQRTQRHAYRQGYEQCLQGLLDYLATHPNVLQHQGKTGAASIPAEDIVNYAQARHAALMAEMGDQGESMAPVTTTSSSGSGGNNNNSNHGNSLQTNSHNTTFGSDETHSFTFSPPVCNTFNTTTPSSVLYNTTASSSVPHNTSTGSTLTHATSNKRRQHPDEVNFLGRDIDMSEFYTQPQSQHGQPSQQQMHQQQLPQQRQLSQQSGHPYRGRSPASKKVRFRHDLGDL